MSTFHDYCLSSPRKMVMDKNLHLLASDTTQVIPVRVGLAFFCSLVLTGECGAMTLYNGQEWVWILFGIHNPMYWWLYSTRNAYQLAPGGLLLTWICVNQAWITNHILRKLWYEITNYYITYGLFLCTFHSWCNYSSMMGLKLSHVSKRSPFYLCS